MNIKQLAKDLEKQGYTCKLSLTGYKDWSVTYYKPFKEAIFYNAATNWSVIKLLNKLLVEV